MKNFAYLFMLFLSLVSTVVNAKQFATVSGKITNPRENKVSLSMYADLITFEPMQYQVNLKDDNTFKIEIQLFEPTIATLTHGNSSIEIYLEDKDDLKIEFHGWDLEATILYSGKGAANNYYLNKSSIKFKRLSDEHLTYQMSNLKPEEFRTYMNQMLQKRLSYFQKFQNELTFSTNFQAYAEADIQYWWAHHLMQYRWEHAFYNDLAAPMDLPESYFDFLNDIEVNNDLALTNLRYIYFLEQYLDYKNSKEVRYNKYGAPIREDYRGAKRFLKGKAMYYVLSNEIYIKCKNKDTYSIGNDVASLMENCPYDNYKSLVKAEYSKANGLSRGELAPNFNLVDVNNEKVSLSDFRGKVVYLDFWATWCTPCTYELLNSKNLKTQFKGKDVIFLYISLDTNMDNWRSFLREHNPEGVHVYAQGVYDAPVAENYSVRGLPSFFLIDKDGKLARVPAKRSSEKGVYEEIESVLSK